MKYLSEVACFCILTLGLALSARANTLRYVWTNSPDPSPPYTNWHHAAHTLQSAADAADPGDEILATNGIYRGFGAGNAGPNVVVLDSSLALRSVNGPADTSVILTIRTEQA